MRERNSPENGEYGREPDPRERRPAPHRQRRAGAEDDPRPGSPQPGQYERDPYPRDRYEAEPDRRDPYSRGAPPEGREAGRPRGGPAARHARGPRGHAGPEEFDRGLSTWGENYPNGDLRYFGTGFPGKGGPGYFTGGAYSYGVGALEEELESQPRAPARPVRRYPPGPKGYQRTDERLREDISERLMQAHDIDSSDVTVEVKGAKVLLEGTVPERRMKHAIEDLADACPGVQDIENRIRVRRE